MSADDFPDGRPLTVNEQKLDALGFKARKFAEELRNAGARLADDRRCSICGVRGYVFTCPDCERGRSTSWDARVGFL